MYNKTILKVFLFSNHKISMLYNHWHHVMLNKNQIHLYFLLLTCYNLHLSLLNLLIIIQLDFLLILNGIINEIILITFILNSLFIYLYFIFLMHILLQNHNQICKHLNYNLNLHAYYLLILNP